MTSDKIKVKVGDHCWALMHGELLVVLKTELEGYEVCGAWECGIGGPDLEILSVINRPKGYEETPLYYLEKEVTWPEWIND